MAGRAQAVGRDRVARIAQLGLGVSRPLDHLGAERVAAEARVLVRLGAAEAVGDVERGDAVAELAEDVPEAGRVGAAGDEHRHLAAGLDQSRSRMKLRRCSSMESVP